MDFRTVELDTNPVFMKIAGFEVLWYSVLILIAVFVSYKFMEAEAARFGIKKSFLFNMLFWAFIFGIVGARLYFVIFRFSDFKDNIWSIFDIRSGGLAIHGGLIAGLITIIVYCKRYNARIIRVLDVIVVPLLLAQAIGRWGNFMNGEAFGAETTAETLHRLFVPDFVIKGMTDINTAKVYMPTFFFESLACFSMFVILMFIRRSKYTKVGTMTSAYLISYGVIRFLIETSRQDYLPIGGFKIAQIVSVIMIIIGLGILMFISRKGKFEDLYNDPTNSTEIKY